MDPALFGALEQAVNASRSTDYMREFGNFRQARTVYLAQANNNNRQQYVDQLAQARAAAAIDQGNIDRLRPMHDRLQEANRRGRISTYASRVASAAVGALAAG